ncbi:Ig-like domain-containing protein [Nocardioides bruguierae]|uniref:Ig-like domain-containing protein n=1 Tax=Nocardioides bruguierae TaxID=2945102 RepID=UPI00201FBB61|nr:Ig-like domain-containing protein [Nocardioides bruguierae]MCL8026153.1 Ig-like domain-containing protein [Nocardioides bruguierae]
MKRTAAAIAATMWGTAVFTGAAVGAGLVGTASAGPAGAELHVDFGNASTTPAAGYLLDFGQPYGDRTGAQQGTDLTYGWVDEGGSTPLDLSSRGRYRNNTGLSDERVNSFMHMALSDGTAGAWEVEVTDGWYEVTVGLGDPAPSYDSVHTVAAEGVTVVPGYAPTSADRLRSATVQVPVDDGRLTLDGIGGSNVKISYVDVVRVSAPVSTVALPFSVDFGAAGSQPVDGSVRDFGEAYGQRADGVYGWLAQGTDTPLSLVGNGRTRNASGLADQRQATFMHMQAGAGSGVTDQGDFGVAVPDGTYRVTVGTGDAGNNYDSSHRIVVEGTEAIAAYTPTWSTKFRTGVVDVEVTDGVLNVSAVGGSNTKINFLDVQDWSDPGGASFPVLVDFGATSSTPADGYLLDSGAAFGAQTGGYSFGWVAEGTDTPIDATLNGRQRSNASTTDPRLQSLMHMDWSGTGSNGLAQPISWELAVPSGTYRVEVAVGDAAGVYDSTHAIDVEGVTTVGGFTPTSANRFAIRTSTVTVVDGRLTIDSSAGTNTKIDYVIIDWIDPSRPRVASITPTTGATDVFRDLSVTTELTLPGGAIDYTTVTEDTVQLHEVDTGAVVPSSANTSGGGDVLVLTPFQTLDPNTEYEFVVTDGVEDVVGNKFLPFSSTFTTGTLLSGTGIDGVAFSQEVAVDDHMFTTMTFGPDGRFYAATLNGFIFRYDVAADGTLSNEYQINTVYDLNGGEFRTIIGLVFDPASTPTDPILWVTDNFMYIGTDDVPDWSSKVDRLTGANLQNGETVIENLPRSAHDHEANSLAFGPDGALYLTMGSNTGMGYPDPAWANRAETELAGAILRIDTDALPASLPLDVKTSDGGGTYDPYAAGAPVTLYATGVRNAFDLVWTDDGQLYAPTNGSAAGANIPSVPETLPDTCSARIDSGGAGAWTYDGPTFATILGNPVAQTDFIHHIVEGGYYGHPNPSRCEFISYGGNPTAGVDDWEETQYPVGVEPDRNFRSEDVFDASMHASANGVLQYSSDVFGDLLAGELLVVRYSAGKDVMVVDRNGAGDVTGLTTGVTGFTGFAEPLDIAEAPDGSGVLYVSELGASRITLLRPVTD